MAPVTATLLALCASELGAFGWGMAWFFQKPSGHRGHTAMVGGLGLVFAAWHLWAIWSSTPVLWRGVAAAGLYAAALGLFGWAVRSCGRRRLTAIFEPDAPRYLVVEGPYRFVRHPFYGAYILFWTAGALASGSSIAMASVLVMSAIYIRAARDEERKFRVSAIAEAHAAYCRRTGFLIPQCRD
ncbi:MAG: isoprenylcysteine carboxylmethyltransferase family protein [Vicinamibacterales bacterium]